MAQKIGLEAVLDLRQFRASSKIFINSIDKMNSSIGKMAKNSTKSFTSMEGAMSRIGSSFRRIRDIITGVLVIDVFRKISRGIADMRDQAINAVDTFQRLEIRLQSIAAIEFADKFGGTVSEALGQVNDRVQATLGWIRKIAVTTPFSVESIANALAYAQAFGFAENQAKRLTLATGEFVAGMGLTDENMQRIIWNFGQMMASGRVLGREIRDLANNMVPVMEITERLAEQYGVTTQEMKEMMKEGRISAEEFIGTFVQLAETDFEGAMGRMSRTLSGVRQNIKDFIDTVLGVDVLGPVIDKITAGLAETLDALFNEKIVRAAQATGFALLNAYTMVADAIKGSLVPAISELLKAFNVASPTAFTFASAILKAGIAIKFMVETAANAVRGIRRFVEALGDLLGTDLGEIADNAESWGANIIISFARGMANAISYIVQVLTKLARVITSWLRGQSPPRLLPDLPEWGRSAMESYMEGWASADFSVFEDIAGKIASFIRSIRFKIDETDIIPKILGGREGLTKAIESVRETGVVTEEALDKIFKKAGITSDALREYIKLMLNLEAASKQAAEAQKLLDFDIEEGFSVEVFDTIVSDLESMREAAENFTGALRESVFAYIDALERQKEATEEAAEAQDNLDQVAEHYDDVLKELRAELDALNDTYEDSTRLNKIENALVNERLTKEERLRLETERRRILLQRQIRDTERQRDIEEEAARDRLNEAEEVADEAEDSADRQKRAAEDLTDKTLDALKEQVAAQEGLVKAIIDTNELWAKQLELLERLEEAAKKAAGGAGEMAPDDEAWDEFWGGLEESIPEAGEDLQGAIDALTQELQAKFDKFVEALTEPFAGVSDEIKRLVAGWKEAFESFTESETFQKIQETLTTFVENLKIGFTNLRIFWEENGPEIIEVIKGFFSDLAEALGLSELGESALGGVLGIIDGIGQGFADFTQKMVENGPQIVDRMREVGKYITEEFIPDLQDKWKWVKEEFIPSVIEFGKSAAVWLPPVALAFAGLAGSIKLLKVSPDIFKLFLLFTWIKDLAPSLASLKTGLASLGVTSGSVAPLISGLGVALGVLALVLATIGVYFVAFTKNIGGFRDTMLKVWGIAKKQLGPAFEELKEVWKEFTDALALAFPNIEGVGDLLGNVASILGDVLAFVLTVLIIPAIQLLTAVLTAGMRTISFVLGAVTGALEGVREFMGGFQEAIDALVEFLKLPVSSAITWEETFKNIENFIQKFSAGVKKMFSGMFKFLINLFKVSFGTVIKFAWEFVQSIITFFLDLVKELVGGSIIPDLISDMLEIFTTGFADMLAGLVTWIDDMIAELAAFATEMLAKGKELIDNLAEGISSGFTGPDGILTKFANWLQELVDEIPKKFEEVKTKGQEFVQNLIDGLKSKTSDLLAAIGALITAAIGELQLKLTSFYQWGVDVIQNIVKGISDNAYRLINALKDLAKKALGPIYDWIFGGGPDEDDPWEVDPDCPPGDDCSSTSNIGVRLARSIVSGFVSETARQQSTVTEALGNMFARSFSDAASFATASLNNQFTLPAVSPTGASQTIGSIDQSTSIEVNPTYAGFQSEADIFHDISAALATFRR